MNDSEIVKSAFSNVSGFNITYVCSNMSSCDTIENLQLPSRNLSGIVAWRTLSGLVHLRTLDLSNNSLCGGISEDVWTMPSLRKLNLAMNCFGGTLHFNWSKSGGPSKYSVLETLNLSRNRLELFESTLDLSGFRSLKVLDLSRNKIIGNKVFVQLFNLKNLTNVSLAGNSLNSIPLVSQNSNAIMHLDVSYNNLSGNISSLAKFTSLQYLDLSSNNLTGVFPTDFPSLKNLRFLNLSINNFTGSINAGSIKKFHISAFLHSGICNNTLKVPCDQSLASPSPSKLPTIVNRSPPPLYTFASHSSASHSPFHKKKATIAGVLSSGAVLMVVIAILLCFRRRRQRLKTQKWVVPKPPLTWKIDRSSTESGPFSFETESFTWVADIKDSNSVPVSIFEKPLLNLTFSDLLSATSHFSKESQLADGQHGPVYRAILPGEIHVAIKVMEEAKDLDTEEAEAKFVALGRLKHPNILPLLGYCIAGKEKLLLYEFMQNGDLHQWLHELPRGQPNTEDWSMDTWEQQTDGVPVSGERMGWITRHRIALGIARALAFLHHGSSPPIIHGGLSPFNVLLDEHFEPHMAQSGIRDLVKTTRRASFNLAYAAPESTMALNESAKGEKSSQILMANTLGSLHLPETSKELVAKKESIHTLIEMMGEANEEECAAAINALINLSSVSSISKTIEYCNGIPILLKLLTAVKSSESIKAAHILSNMSSAIGDQWQEDAHSEAQLEQIVSTFLSLMGSITPPNVHYYLLQGLMKLANGKETSFTAKVKMNENNSLKLLISLWMAAGDQKVKRSAVQLFSCLSNSFGADACSALKEQTGSLNIILDMLKEGCTESDHVIAASILADLPVDDNQMMTLLLKANIIPQLVQLLENSNTVVVEACTGALLKFCLKEGFQQKLAELKVVQKMVSLLSSGRSLTKERAAKALSYFSKSTPGLSKRPDPPKCWACFSPRPVLCKLHLGICHVDSTYCLLEAEAVKPLVSILKEQQMSCVAAALDALSTLVDDKVGDWETGCRLIDQEKGFSSIIALISNGTPEIQEICANLCERFFKIFSSLTKILQTKIT